MAHESVERGGAKLRVGELSRCGEVMTTRGSVIVKGVVDSVEIDPPLSSELNGADTRMIEDVCAWADHNSVRLHVDLRALGEAAQPLGKVMAWYGRFGFTSLHGSAYMTRAVKIQDLLTAELQTLYCNNCGRQEYDSSRRGSKCGWGRGGQCAGRLASAYEWSLQQSRTGEIDPELGILSGFVPADFPPGEYRCVYDENGVVYCLTAHDDGTFVWLEEIKAHLRGYGFGRLAMRRFCKWLQNHNACAGLRIGFLGTDAAWLDLFYRRFGFYRDRGGTYRWYPGGHIPDEDRPYFESDEEPSRHTWIDEALKRLGLRRMSAFERAFDD